MKPKISIIIPTYNRANYVEQTIESALAQDYENYEVIVSDNASTDSTTEVVNKYLKNDKFKYYKNETNIGMVKNWHKALYDYSTGDWFLILSDDDYFIDNLYLTKAVELIKKSASVKMVYSNGYIKNEASGEMLPTEIQFNNIVDGKQIFLNYLKEPEKPYFTLCNIIFNKAKALRLKAFENEFNIGCDAELFLLLALENDVGIIQDHTTVYRYHPNNLSKEKDKDWNLFLHNHEYILKPFMYAKSNKLLTNKELDTFLENAIFKYLKTTYITMQLNFPDKKYEYIAYINKYEEKLYVKIHRLFLKDCKMLCKMLISKSPIFYKLSQDILYFLKRTPKS